MLWDFIIENFSWNWQDFCSTGLRPFGNESNDLLPCFQEIVLQIPTYTVFAAISAYNFGSYQRCICRGRSQLLAIKLRILVTIILACIPIIKLFQFYHIGVTLNATDILVGCVESVMWFVHCGYLLSLRYCGNTSHRGPLIVVVVWLIIFILDIIWLQSSRHFVWCPWSLGTLLLDTIYAFTLLPKGNAVYTTPQGGSDFGTDRTSLLTPRYTYFHFDFNESLLGHAQDEASLLSRFCFNWVNPLIAKGVAGNLKRIEDLYDLPDALNIQQLSDWLQINWYRTKNLFWALHRVFGKEFYLIGLLRFVADVTSFVGPLLLGGLLSQESSHNDDNTIINWRPYVYALSLLSAQLLYAFCSTHFTWLMSMIGMKMRIALVNTIYRKTLAVRGLKESRSEILNLMSTDTDRIVNSCISFHTFWSIPFQLFTTLYLLYTQLGAAFIAGVIFATALIPINRWLAKRIAYYSENLMTAKDGRIKITREMLTGAKQIKLHAWEGVFIKKVLRLRQDELKFLGKRKYLDALCVYFWATTTVLMCFLTFAVSVLMGRPLVAATTYTSVALFNLLIGPLNAFPWVLNGLVEAWISIKRVQKLFHLPDIDTSSYYNPITRSLFSNYGSDLTSIVLQIDNGTFIHDDLSDSHEEDLSNNQSSFRLMDISVEIKKSELVCIEGPVGSGKSSLLTTFVAGMELLAGYVCVKDLAAGFGYVPQSPWLQRGTIRDNILWGAVYDEQWYKSVLYGCALNADIIALGGDLIEVGENGHALSGGQRARVALARAVYQDKKVYIFDDILTCLDAHVAQHIIKYCILGLLKEKTRIIVTRNIALFYHANQILHVEHGKLIKSEIMSDGSNDFSMEAEIENNESDESVNETERRNSLNLDEVQTHNKNNLNTIMLEESREFGHLSLSVFSCYWNAVTSPLAIGVMSLVILMQLTRNLSDAWLAHWVTDSTLPNNRSATVHLKVFDVTEQLNLSYSSSPQPAHTNAFYLGIYATLALGNSMVTLFRAFLFAYAGLKAAKFIHEKMLKTVLYTKFSFFDVTPVGRILNRFSSDTNTIDDSLPFILNICLAQIAGLVGAFSICLYAMPWLSLIVIPIIPIYLNLQKRYRHASRDIKRLSSNALSPLYTHFTETVQGLMTIRTMRASARFQRDFDTKLEESIKAQLTAAAAQSWLALRLQLLGTLLVGGAGLLAAITSLHTTNPGFVGLALSYALTVTSTLSGVLNAIAETEQELVAIERTQQYLVLEPEKNANGTAPRPFGWPSQGVIQYQNVQLCYRENATPVLNDLCFKTEAFEHIAIVGRTGAGKSSILAALLRVVPLTAGEIILDNINTETLNISVLRDRLCIIPQEPFLFEGTIRQNLDPCSLYYDSEIWHAITNCSEATYLIQNLGGLDGKLESDGINLSSGQKQLLCLVRALLKNALVLCIDEGTSNLDAFTETAIHRAIKVCFRKTTVLFVAHRLAALNAMDRIIVMDNGRILEQGAPQKLANDESSVFHAMLLAQHINIDDFCNNSL